VHRNRSAPPGPTAREPVVSPEQVAAWLAASCQAQGVPVLVTDARVLGRVAALLTPAAGGPASARQRGKGRPAAASQPPDRPHPR
jgi:hypothetical protein